MRTLVGEIERQQASEFLGLNLDIAHARIIQLSEGNMSAGDLRPLVEHLVHAHISDHPGMHTRDQAVGEWTSVFRPDGGYTEYLKLLLDRARAAHTTRLPFSKVVSLELEGCNRIGTVGKSLFSMRQAIAMVEARYP